eukprot:11829018-Ditylum_brightwellii.AAC.1
MQKAVLSPDTHTQHNTRTQHAIIQSTSLRSGMTGRQWIDGIKGVAASICDHWSLVRRAEQYWHQRSKDPQF